MFRHILVPLDGSVLAEGCLPHLVAIARAGCRKVTLLRVLDSDHDGISSSRPVDPFDWQLRKAEAETYLRQVAERLAQAGLPVDIELREGRAAETVIVEAQEKGADLILLSSHGQSGLSGWNVSGAVQKILMRARTSIMIVRAYRPCTADLNGLTYKNILLPLDGTPRAESVFPVATALARANDAVILAVHVVHEPELPRRTPPGQEDLALAAQLTERNRAEAAEYLDSLNTQLDGKIETRLLVEGSVVTALQRLAEDENVDLVVLSAHGYSGDTRVPYGSVVISFIVYGTSPLLVIQDLPADRLQPSLAEQLAREKGLR
jgi:nucleotide-binding universal stress UspA family protein